jgi:spermidine synthase
MSAFLGNTVFRFSVTIGLYLCSMGIGAFLAEDKFIENPLCALLKVELLLILFGGLSIVHLHIINIIFGNSEFVFSIFSHMLIVLIGILTGFELPAMMELRHQGKSLVENMVLGFSYVGAFLGTLVFAFWFYPRVGLMATSFMVGTLNTLTSLFGVPLLS